MNLKECFKKFIDEWQELFIILPVLGALLWVARSTLPTLDPAAGIDGLGFLYSLVPTSIAFVVSGFLAWLSLRLYGVELSAKQEKDAMAGCVAGNIGSMFLLALPRIQWLIVFALVWSRAA